jgi:hypothetical protein
MRPRDKSAAADLLAMGFGEDEIRDAQDQEAVPVYPDSVDPMRLFGVLITQWRMGPGGPTGLDHSRRDIEARRLGLRARKRRKAFDGLAVMESEALAVIAEQAKQAMSR